MFGGYTSESWGFGGSGGGQSKHDSTAFIYSLTNKDKCSTQKNTSTLSGTAQGVGRASAVEYGGCDSDIYICNNCNTKNSSYSDGNNTYQLPPGADAKTYLAGSYKFLVKEIEVYSVTPQ